MTSRLLPCSSCGRPRKSTARGNMCRECWRLSRQYAKQFCCDCGAELATSGKSYITTRCRKCHDAYRATHPELHRQPKKQCERCGATTRRKSGICVLCETGAESDGMARIRYTPELPETCPKCAGLPWRRGEKTGDTCRVCGLAWEPEELPPLAYYLRRDVERTIAVGGLA